MEMLLVEIGKIRSSIKDLKDAPKMENEAGAVQAKIDIDPIYLKALDKIEIGSRLEIFTWFHEADRTVLKVHPRADTSRPKRGVFGTRSPFRPNPIGHHKVTLVAIENNTTLIVEPLEAIDGTPVVDIKSERSKLPK